jgi:putative acetyltransferase
MEIRSYRESDAVEIADLFHSSVHAVAAELYTDEEKEAWAPSPPDYPAWKLRLSTKKPFVAVKQSVIVGFIELEEDGHIDCLYVHKDYQSLGIGGQLLEYIIRTAGNRGIASFYTEASKMAMPLFKKFGFIYKSKNIILLRGQILANYNMALAENP